MRRGPTPIQRLDPPATTPMPGTSTATRRPRRHQRAARSAAGATGRSGRGACRRRRWRRGPSTGPGARRCPHRPVVLQRRVGRGRQDHHEPDGAQRDHHAEDGGARRDAGRGARRRAPGPGRRPSSPSTRRRWADGRPVATRAAATARGWRRCSPATLPGPTAAEARHGAHAPGEVVAPLRVGPVPVERRARRRQHHRVARARPSDRGGLDGLGHGRRPRHGDEAGEGRRDLLGGLADGHHRPQVREPPSARTDRSRPLLRPPAISTAGAHPSTAASTAPGVVALESS